MNARILHALQAALEPFSLPPQIVFRYLRTLLLRTFDPDKNYGFVPIDVVKVTSPILKKQLLCADGTPTAFTPEILALLRETYTDGRKSKGVFYTPWPLAQMLAKETLDALEKTRGSLSARTLRSLHILDPAAGAGGLLLPFALELAQRICVQTHQKEKTVLRHILQHQLYAADLCAGALEDYQFRAQLLVGGNPLILHTFLGDSLSTSQGQSILKTTFPSVFERGGFDIVLSNPPYIGQKNNAALFKCLHHNPLWTDYIKPKSDLSYLFFHLAMHLLRPEGIAGFLTPPYFATAQGALYLRQTMQQSITFLRLLDFNGKTLFPDASPHTLLSVFLNQPRNIPCRVGIKKIEVSPAHLWEGKNIFLRTQAAQETSPLLPGILKKMSLMPYTLGDIVKISNGLMTGCDKISAAHLRKFKLPGVQKGSGVFVLSDAEKAQLPLNKYERQKIKPFFKNSAITPYAVSRTPFHWLIDLFYPNDRDLNLSHYPHLLAHLARFKPVLLARRQNNNGIQHQLAAGNYWFGSVRRKMDFEEEKLVCPHRAKQPCFAYSKGPWYASSDVYFISHPATGYSLWAILALLNSPLTYLWLYYNGKRKGELLELYAQPLSLLPIPKLSIQQCKALSRYAREITALKSSNSSKGVSALERKISHLTAQIFHLTAQEEALIYSWVNTPKNILAN